MRRPATPPAFPLDREAAQAIQERAIQALQDGSASEAAGAHYLHWDELRHRDPPRGLSHLEWWAALKLQRGLQRRLLPLATSEGAAFSWVLTDSMLEGLAFIDTQLAGQVVLSEDVTNPETRDRFIVRSLIEEAITSSQLEGAATTHDVAKEMIRTGRPPRTRDERMILNNYRAMQFVRERVAEPLSRKLLFELHRIVVEDAIDPPDAAGRLRDGTERVLVRDLETQEVVHVPPPAELLEARLEAMCRFANGEPGKPYLPPAMRAMLLHFWLAYDHPFVDGNGRTARALFYWQMLRQGYWLSEFLSISSIVRKAPMQYARAFQLVETDDRDVTYFLLHHLGVIRKAHDALKAFLERKQREVRETEGLLRTRRDLNHRQLAILSHALRHPRAEFTVASHQMSHRVAYDTARLDLTRLEQLGYLVGTRVGRKFRWRPGPVLAKRARRTPGSRSRPRRP
ncbi:MAG TPA: Fic family protein [Planctomycetota bacterium]|nr:Fic family protein [Planctomycetota bacterium]